VVMKKMNTEKVFGIREGEGATPISPKIVKKIKETGGITIVASVRKEFRRGIKTTISVAKAKEENTYIIAVRDYYKNRVEDRYVTYCDFDTAVKIFAKFAKQDTVEVVESVEKVVSNYIKATEGRGE